MMNLDFILYVLFVEQFMTQMMSKVMIKEEKMKTFRKCFRCDSWLKKETHKGLRERYPFVCPYCNENMYYFESVKVKRNKHEYRKENKL